MTKVVVVSARTGTRLKAAARAQSATSGKPFRAMRRNFGTACPIGGSRVTSGEAPASARPVKIRLMFQGLLNRLQPLDPGAVRIRVPDDALLAARPQREADGRRRIGLLVLHREARQRRILSRTRAGRGERLLDGGARLLRGVLQHDRVEHDARDSVMRLAGKTRGEEFRRIPGTISTGC